MSDEAQFPARLYYVLHSDDDQLRTIVSFLVHGRAFRIHDVERFRNAILPVWFNQMGWEEFQEQLRAHGFRRLTQGPDEGAYYHEYFLRRRLHLVRHIREDRNGPREAMHPEDEPNFQMMPMLDFQGTDSQQQSTSSVVEAPVSLSALGPTLGSSVVAWDLHHLATRSLFGNDQHGGMSSNSTPFDMQGAAENVLQFLREQEDSDDEDEEDMGNYDENNNMNN